MSVVTPQMEMENCERQKDIFSCQKRATQEAPFLDLEKNPFDRVFEMDSWNGRIQFLISFVKIDNFFGFRNTYNV